MFNKQIAESLKMQWLTLVSLGPADLCPSSMHSPSNNHVFSALFRLIPCENEFYWKSSMGHLTIL